MSQNHSRFCFCTAFKLSSVFGVQALILKTIVLINEQPAFATMKSSSITQQVAGELKAVYGYWLVLLVALPLGWLMYTIRLHPLNRVPGPAIARATRWWLLWVTLEGKQHWRYVEAHQKYGAIVRIKPNTVIINDPQFLQANFFEWDKSDWWLAFRTSSDHVPHGNELNIRTHKLKKQRVMGAFSLSSILRNESNMDDQIVKLKTHFFRLAEGSIVFDLAPWTQYAAFDIVMEMLFSNPPGFLHAGTDVNGITKSLHVLLTAASVLASFPIIQRFILLPWINTLVKPRPTDEKGPGAIHGLAKKQVQQRLDSCGVPYHEKHDVLQWIIDHNDRNGEPMSREMLEKEALDQVFAGSDTTSAAVRVIILYVSTYPRVLRRLSHQIQRADDAGLLSTPVAKFQEFVKNVPYIEAIFKEALRIYPIIGTPQYRKVPSPGVTFNGYYLPAGTEVGLSQWAVARNARFWGSDVDVFRPERWTEATDSKSAAALRQGDIFFSNGTMMCTGRNLAIVEVYKIIVEIFRSFEVTIVNPVRPWKERDNLIMLHWDYYVTLTHKGRL